MTTVRAKFKVQSITETEGGLKTANLHPVYGNSGDPNDENTKFFKATPSGQIQLGVMNDMASRHFKPAREFYVDFTPCDEAGEQPATDVPIGQPYKDAKSRDDEQMKK